MDEEQLIMTIYHKGRSKIAIIRFCCQQE